MLDALVATWPVVGRDAVVRRVLSAFDRGAGGVVLTGAAGVGKSRVARVIVAEAALRGASTEWIQSTEGARDIPLGAFSHLIPKGTDAATPLELLRRSAAAIVERHPRRRVVLAVDDAHLLDPGSATLVHQLASSGQAFVVATVRTGEVVPDAVLSMWKDGIADRVEVDTLDRSSVHALLCAALGDDVEQATSHRLWTATRGNALFLHELVLAGVRSGALNNNGPLWRWRGPLTGDGALRDVLEVRLVQLSVEERAALDVLAVGEPLGVDVYEHIVGIDIVDRLERQELVRVWRDERREEASLVHPLYRDLLRDAMSSATMASLQERLAQALGAVGGRRRGDLLRIAMWRLSGQGEAEPDVLLAGADEAESRFDAILAEQLARAAIDRGGARAWHSVASALRAQGRNHEADDAWAQALQLETDPAKRVLLAQSRSANLFFGLGEADRAIALLEGAFPDATTQPLRDTIGSLVAMFDLYRGRIDAALAAAAPILDRSDVADDARIDAALTASAALALRGRPTDALAIVDANLGLALQSPGVGSIAAGALMVTRILALTLDGRLADAALGAQVIYELAVDMGTDDGIAGLSYALGNLLASMGDVDAARKRLTEAASLLREHDRNGYLPWCLAELAYVEIAGGRLDEARAAVEELDAVHRPQLRLFQPRVDTVKLLLTGLDGEPERAIDGLLAAGRSASDEGHLVLGAMALHEAIRFGGADRVADALTRLALSTDSALVRMYAGHARAATAGDGAELDRVAAELEEAGALLTAAEASAAASAAYRSTGRNPEQLAAQHRARALLARCRAAAPPWLDLGSVTEPLTTREHEIATLAAAGLSSREIAGRLYLSVRTVDNHLHRTYSKLGIQSREELAIVLSGATVHAGE